MELIQEMKDHNIPAICTKPYVYCKVFEVNSGALELARLPKFLHAPSTSTYVTTIFASMYAKD
jgi:hypothetical protein